MSEREPNMFSGAEDSGESAPRENFDKLKKQFDDPGIIEVGGEKLDVVDVKPENLKSEVPVFVAPGWAANAKVFEDNILWVAESGRRTLSLNNFHGIKPEKAGDYPEVELRKVAGLIKILDEKGIDKVDMIAHSEGGLYTTIAATMYPERFRNLVLVAPAGMIGKDSFSRLSVCFTQEIVRQFVESIGKGERRRPMFRAFFESGKAAMSPLKAFKEVVAISNAEIPNMLKNLKEKGIGISIIHGVKDKAFPMDRVQKTAKADQMHGFYSVAGGHNEIYLRSKEFSRLAAHAVDALEERQNK